MTNITSQDIADWLQEQVNKAHQLGIGDYASVQASLNQISTNPKPATFSIWIDGDNRSGTCGTIEECFTKLAGITPEKIAAEKREKAAALIAEAKSIEEGIKS